MAKVVTDSRNYKDIADQIRNLCKTDPSSNGWATKQYTPSEMMGGIYGTYQAGKNVGYEEGYNNAYDLAREHQKQLFWSAYQSYGSPKDYSYGFAGAGWNDGTFYPLYPIVLEQNSYGGYMFYTSYVTNIRQRLIDCNVTLDVSGANSAFCMFTSSKTSEIPTLNFSELCSTVKQAFLRCTSLVTIEKIYANNQMVFDGTFQNCTALENITIVGTIGTNGFNVQWSTKLTHDSLMSIINALGDKSADTSGTEWKVTLGATNKAKLTSEEISVAEAKGWEVA